MAKTEDRKGAVPKRKVDQADKKRRRHQMRKFCRAWSRQLNQGISGRNHPDASSTRAGRDPSSCKPFVFKLLEAVVIKSITNYVQGWKSVEVGNKIKLSRSCKVVSRNSSATNELSATSLHAWLNIPVRPTFQILMKSGKHTNFLMKIR